MTLSQVLQVLALVSFIIAMLIFSTVVGVINLGDATLDGLFFVATGLALWVASGLNNLR